MLQLAELTLRLAPLRLGCVLLRAQSRQFTACLLLTARCERLLFPGDIDIRLQTVLLRLRDRQALFRLHLLRFQLDATHLDFRQALGLPRERGVDSLCAPLVLRLHYAPEVSL